MNQNKALIFTDFLMVVASFIVLILSITTAISGSSRPEPDSYVYLIGLILPAIIISSLILIIYWSIRRSFMVLLPLIAIAINYNSVLNNFQFRGGNTDSVIAGKTSIKIATYNVHGFRYNDELTSVNNISEFFKLKSIDIACFQEFNNPSFLNIQEVIGYFDFLPYHFIKKSDMGEIGMAIFSRYPILRSGRVDFENTGNGIIWADVQINSRKVVRVINNHLQTTNYDRAGTTDFAQKIESLRTNSVLRAHQAEVERAIIDTTTIQLIVCGDFNDIPTSYTYKTIKGDDLSDGFREAGSWMGDTFRGIGGLLRIDYIFHSKEFKSITYSNPNLDLSDHRPVISELIFRY